MKYQVSAIAALALSTTVASAGGIDRSGQGIGILFEKGNYAELSFGNVTPDVSGVGAGVAPNPAQPTPGQASGNMASSYTQYSLGVKTQLNEQLSFALILDQPFGANVNYPAGTTYYARGSTATLETSALTGVLKYTLPSNLSVYGGLRYETMRAEASIPFVANYTAQSDNSSATGYLVGVAYEKPEIALRVALTYNSKITHNFSVAETSALTAGNTLTSTTEVNSPQSVNLDFQSGVAKDTLVFGSIRWVDWSAFEIAPAHYAALTSGGSLVSYDSDTITYSLGVGRRLNENWAVAASVGYEAPVGGFASNLGPTDGKTSLTLGATYTKDNMKITGGVSYVKIGDAQTTLGAGLPAADFEGNSALGVGIKIGFSF